MKSYLFKLSLNLLLILVAGFSFVQSKVVKFEKNTLTFKKVEEGEKIILKYYFRNNGKHTLSIIPPIVDCSCTEVMLPENKIAGGAKDSIIIHFDTNDKIGFQERNVNLQFENKLIGIINQKITFKGVVKASKATKETYKKSKNN